MSILLIITFPNLIFAQEVSSSYPFNAGLELNTKYVWRGISLANTPVIFPTIGFHYKNFILSAFGGYAVDGNYSEVDWFLTYETKNYIVSAGDYFFPNENHNNNYLNYKSQTTPHTVELCVTYNFSRFPIWMVLSSFVFGNDRKENGKNYYSSYFEIGYYKQFLETDKLSFLLGITPSEGFYSDKFNIINISVKYDTNIPLGNYQLPVSGAFVLNPEVENVFLTFSIYILK